jgi:hypothetical protein
MNKLVLVCVVVGGLVTGCKSKRIVECDEFVATAEKLAKCDKVPAAQQQQISSATKTIKDALKMLDDAGGADQAPTEVLNQMKDMCRSQNKVIVDEFTKIAPECVK